MHILAWIVTHTQSFPIGLFQGSLFHSDNFLVKFFDYWYWTPEHYFVFSDVLLLPFSTKMPYFHVELTCPSPLTHPVREYEADALWELSSIEQWAFRTSNTTISVASTGDTTTAISRGLNHYHLSREMRVHPEEQRKHEDGMASRYMASIGANASWIHATFRFTPTRQRSMIFRRESPVKSCLFRMQQISILSPCINHNKRSTQGMGLGIERHIFVRGAFIIRKDIRLANHRDYPGTINKNEHENTLHGKHDNKLQRPFRHNPTPWCAMMRWMWCVLLGLSANTVGLSVVSW